MPEIVYEDNHLIVAVKPPNLLTQGDATGDDCLLDLRITGAAAQVA